VEALNMAYEIALGDSSGLDAALARGATSARLWLGGREHEVALTPDGDAYEVRCDGELADAWVAVAGDSVFVHAFGRAWELSVVDPAERARAEAEGADTAIAPMPGTVVSVAVAPGDAVHAGQVLVVIESMKMQSEIVASRDGVVARIALEVGESFDRGAALVDLEPLAADPEPEA
jgi:biotin carboxyl carrier protein